MTNAIITAMKAINAFGMGSEPIAIVIAAMTALFLTQKSIKERNYADTAIVFGINWGLMMATGIGNNVALLAIYWIIIGYGIFFNKKEAEKVAHTISKG